MNSSLIIQTGFLNSEKIELCHMENFVKEIFDYFNIDIKEMAFSYDRTNKYLKFTQKNMKKFRKAYINEKINNVRFYSLNTSDFEPNSSLIISLSYNDGFGMLKCIIDSSLIYNNYFSNFISLCKMIKKYFPISTCCAFWVPEEYYPLSFSEGILRKWYMPCEYKNIAGWIRAYSEKLTIIGNYNYICSDNEKIRDTIISLLGKSEYITDDDCLYFTLNGTENIGELILTDKYNKISEVLTEHNLLEANEYFEY